MAGKRVNDIQIGDCAEKQNLVDYESVTRFAGAVDDYNPLHFDTEEARKSRYGGPIAHGMMLAGFISGVIGTSLPGNGCIYEKQSLNFLRPVFHRDMILTRVTVREKDIQRNRVVLATECFNQNGELVLSGEAVVLPPK